MAAAPKDTWRIARIALDEETILWRNADVEQERRVAIYDLIEDNVFKPLRPVAAGHDGPYDLKLAVQDGRLALTIGDMDGQPLETLVLGLAPADPRVLRDLRQLLPGDPQGDPGRDRDDRHGAPRDS
jgi:uncharacterized protein (UPF0262 family)